MGKKKTIFRQVDQLFAISRSKSEARDGYRGTDSKTRISYAKQKNEENEPEFRTLRNSGLLFIWP